MGLDKEDIMALIAILQKGLVDDIDSSTVEYEQPQPKPRKTKNKEKPKKNNLFENMTEFKMHKEDVEIDRKLNKQPPTQRSRNYKPLKVKCRVCGKDVETNPSLVESIERYKCNKCSTSAG